tara:strand:- start:203 stop:577 length:375 start_codon:yes stop_codon:yes gene_type:complete
MKIYVVFIFIFLNQNVHAEIYKWVDAEGVTHFSQNINDVPESQEVQEIEIKASNTSQSVKKKVTSSGINTKNKETNKYTSKQLEKKCDQLSRIWAKDPNGFNSPSYRKSRELGCGTAAMKRLRN